MTDVVAGSASHVGEPHDPGVRARLNWLRAGVLGANDGIVSTAALVVGVAAASSDRSHVLVAGVAGLTAGAMSMAAGEYVSVSTQRDTEQALVEKERRELREEPDEELAELTELYERKGLSPTLASKVAEELTEHDALAAHLEVELGIDPDKLTSPWQAAGASAASFVAGSALPLLAALVAPAVVPTVAVIVVLALALTGAIAARVGGAPTPQAVARNVAGGALAMGVTYLVGTAIGTLGA